MYKWSADLDFDFRWTKLRSNTFDNVAPGQHFLSTVRHTNGLYNHYAIYCRSSRSIRLVIADGDLNQSKLPPVDQEYMSTEFERGFHHRRYLRLLPIRKLRWLLEINTVAATCKQRFSIYIPNLVLHQTAMVLYVSDNLSRLYLIVMAQSNCQYRIGQKMGR
jgi:hypothetical protein